MTDSTPGQEAHMISLENLIMLENKKVQKNPHIDGISKGHDSQSWKNCPTK